jgi:hypothetical protein
MRAYNNKKKPERRTDAARIERILSRWSFSDAKVQHVFNKALRRDENALAQSIVKKSRHASSIDRGLSRD